MAPKSRNAGKIKLISASSSEASPKSSKKTHERKDPRVFTYVELEELTDGFNTPIGEGKYGKVYKGTFNYRDIAVKVYDYADKAYWENERDALSSLDDVHIVSLIGIQCDDEEHFSLVLNYVPGNLEVVLQEMKLEWPGVHKILLQLAMAIQEISRKDFVVGDIKPDNVLLDKEYNVFVCDFGSARKGGKNIPTVNWHYTARELFINGNGSSASDVYSFGVILLQMIMKINDFGEVPTKSSVTRPERMSKRKGGSSSSRKEEKNHISVIAKYYKQIDQVVHKTIVSSGCSTEDAIKLAKLGISCTDDFENRRPSIDEVISQLRGLKSES
ncbi:probable receptor-like protein kinase At4g10390 [Primulina eburnea]|uniref:probable receptor-like protein kinase At4g10390 n=1 Tax=Primulina eburnea TaxID=1245227 RepID=UPI003C6C1A8A